MYKIMLTFKNDDPMIELGFVTDPGIEIAYVATNDRGHRLQIGSNLENFCVKNQWELIKKVKADNIDNILVTVNDITLYSINEEVVDITYLVNFTENHILETLTFNLM